MNTHPSRCASAKFTFLAALAATVLLFIGDIRAAEQWEAIPDPYDGPVTCFVEDAAGTLWAGSAGSGVFKSTDGGDTWTEFREGMTFGNVHALLAAPNGDMYAATYSGGVYKLAKGAKEWQQMNQGLVPSWPSDNLWSVASLVMNSAGDMFACDRESQIYCLPAGATKWTKVTKPGGYSTTLAIAKSGRLWSGYAYSDDKGQTWTQATKPGEKVNIVWSLAIDDATGTIYVGSRLNKYGADGGGIYVSKDQGKTWTCPEEIGTKEELRGIAVAGGKVFACTKTLSDIGSKVFVSSDNGQTWKRCSNGLDNLCSTIGLGANKKGDVFLGANGAYRSSDGGETWKKLDKLQAKRPCTSLVVTPNGDLYMASFQLHTTCHGVARLRDGKWTELNDGLASWGLTSLALNAKGEVLAADRIMFSYRLIGNGDKWTRSNIKQMFGANSIGLTADKKVILGCYPSAGGSAFMISSDDGSTFEPRWSDGTTKFPQVWDIFVAPDGTIIMTTEQAQECEISTDNGQTHVNLGPPKGSDGGSVGVAPDGTILMSMNNQGIHAYDGGRKPGGKWNKSQEGLESTPVSKFRLNNGHTKTFVATPKGVFWSSDGKKWTKLEGLPVQQASCMFFDAKGHLYVGTSAGIYKSKEPL